MIKRDALRIEIRELINIGLILPPATYKLPNTLLNRLSASTEGVIDESIYERENIPDNGICE